jgi:hypothetical protein
MSSTAINQVLKTAVVALEQATITSDLASGSTSIPVTCKVMTQTPFSTANDNQYTIWDDTFSSGVDGVPNCEKFSIVSITGASAVALSDGIGYTYSATLNILAPLINSYAQAHNAVVFIPGIEMSIQSTDLNARFKTNTDAPKIDFDDESSRFATPDGYGRDPSITGARTTEIDFTEKISWAGSVTTVPIWDKLMKIMAHARKTYSTTGFEYLTSTYANEITATCWMLNVENGAAPSTTVYRYTGCHGGNGSTMAASKIGDVVMLTGKLMGSYIGTQELTTAQSRALTLSPNYAPEVLLSTSVIAPAYVNGSLTTKQLKISQFSLDFGGVVNPFIDQQTTTGQAYYATTDADPKFNCNPAYVRKSLDDVDYLVTNMITGPVTVKTAHMQIEIFNAQLLSPALANREGYENTNRVYRALRNDQGNGSSESTVPASAMYGILIGTRSL